MARLFESLIAGHSVVNVCLAQPGLGDAAQLGG